MTNKLPIRKLWWLPIALAVFMLSPNVQAKDLSTIDSKKILNLPEVVSVMVLSIPVRKYWKSYLMPP